MLSYDIMELRRMEMVRKQTYITPAQDRALKRLAERSKTTEAEIMRRALDGWLRKQGARDSEDPFEALIGLFEGPTEVNHDDIYH